MAITACTQCLAAADHGWQDTKEPASLETMCADDPNPSDCRRRAQQLLQATAERKSTTGEMVVALLALLAPLAIWFVWPSKKR